MTAPSIAVDVRSLVARPSGIGYFTLSLLEHLGRRGAARYVGMAHGPAHGAERLRAAGVTLERHQAPLGVWWQQMTLPKRLRRGDIDLLWSPLFTLPLRGDTPAVVTVHDLTAVLYPETHRLKIKLSILPFLGASLDRARHVAVDSRATAADLVRQFPDCATKTSVVYPGVDPEFAPGDAAGIATTREGLGCPAGYFLFVGTIEPRKNLGVLLDAWETLRRRNPDALPLVVAGSYGWRSRATMARIEALAESSGLRWVESPERASLIRLYQAARGLVLPSLYEGFGLPAAEAMACRIPTVVSDRSSLPEVVGAAGLTFEPDDAEGLAGILERLTRERSWAEEIGERGLEAASRFAWERSARQMEEIMSLALG